jgi:AraC family transcriptional regulator of arabinose operon
VVECRVTFAFGGLELQEGGDPLRTWRAMQLIEKEGFLDVIERRTVQSSACPALRKFGLLEVGVTKAGGEWCFIRPEPAFGLVLATIAGKGLVVSEGGWREAGENSAYIMPAGAPHGYRVSPEVKEWSYAWVRFEPDADYPSLFGESRPRMAEAMSYSISAANHGLLEEVAEKNDPGLTGIWCDLIRASLVGLVAPAAGDPRIAAMWSVVGSRLGEEWELEQMARAAHMGREHLRRLCLKHDGCSPKRRLAVLRLRKSCELLLLTNATIEEIAGRVGYADAFSFSKAFTREFGMPPSKYRDREKVAARNHGID